MKTRTGISLGCALAFTAQGCTSVLDATGFHVTAEAIEAPDSSIRTIDAGSDACASGTTRLALENACTGAVCVPFAIPTPSCDGGLCPLPPPAAPVDAGAPANPPDSGLPLCTGLANSISSIVFVTGSTALKAFVQEVSKALATQPTNPITVVYQASGSCVGVKAAIDPAANPMSPSLGPTTYYDATGALQSCSLDPANPVAADIGISDVFYSTCYMNQALTPPLPQDVAESYGPVQVMNFAVPQGAAQRSISLSAAYYIFGFGGNSFSVPPWTNPALLQVRTSSSGTQSMIAAAIGVPADRWFGVQNASSSAVGNALTSAGQSSDPVVVNGTLGILASDYLKQNTQTLRGLAVKDDNGGCAYYPSMTATSHDLANVRDGHYPLWGPSHFYARVNTQTELPIKTGVSGLIDGISGIAAVPGLDLIAEYAATGLVPSCAMRVSRASDGAEYAPSNPSLTCNCYFDLIATGSTSCAPCSTNADCTPAAPNCNKFGPAPQQGYCDL